MPPLNRILRAQAASRPATYCATPSYVNHVSPCRFASQANARVIIMTYTQDSILRIKTVMQRTGLTRSTIYRKIHEGTFPRQIRLSTNCAGWYESAINRWIANPSAYHGADNGNA